MHSMQAGYMEKAQKYTDKAFMQIEKLRSVYCVLFDIRLYISPVGFVACWAVKITYLLTDLLYTDRVIVTLLSSIVAILYFRTKLFYRLTI